MRALLIPLAAVFALPVFADTSPKRGGVNYKVFSEVGAVAAARAWYITPNGRFVANQAGTEVVLTDTVEGKESGKLAGHAGGIHDAGFSANGKFMTTAGNDAGVKVWDLSTFKEVRSFDPFGAYS